MRQSCVEAIKYYIFSKNKIENKKWKKDFTKKKVEKSNKEQLLVAATDFYFQLNQITSLWWFIWFWRYYNPCGIHYETKGNKQKTTRICFDQKKNMLIYKNFWKFIFTFLKYEFFFLREYCLCDEISKNINFSYDQFKDVYVNNALTSCHVTNLYIFYLKRRQNFYDLWSNLS